MNNSNILTACLWAASFLAATQTQSVAQALFSDNFDTDSSAEWLIHEGSGNGTPDFKVEFGVDYSAIRYVSGGVTNSIPPAPNSSGTTRGLRLTVNNNDDVASTSAVSLFPRTATFRNNYALRVDMWLNYNGPAYGGTGSTELGTFGLNHAGDKVVWYDTKFLADGVWFAVAGEAGAGNNPVSDYNAYVGDGVTGAVRFQGSDAGFLDRDGDGIVEFEANKNQAVTHPLQIIFPPPLFESGGAPGKRWVQVEVRQRTAEAGGRIVTWLIDGYVMAEHAQGELFVQTAGKIMIGYMDPFNSIANPRADNFVLYDNLRVVNLDLEPARPVVTLTVSDATAAEPGTDTGKFTVARTGPTTNPLTVQLRTSGTASSGKDYTAIPASITIPAGASSTEVTLTPLNDTVGESDETVLISVVGSSSYDVRESFFGVVTIADDGDVPTVSLSVAKPAAYESNPRSVGRFRVSLSSENSAPTVVNFAVTGTAVNGVDYATLGNKITLSAGATNVVIDVSAKDNSAIDPDRTVILTLAPGTGYVLGAVTNGTVTIRNDDLPAGTLLFSENFDTDRTPAWTVNQGPGDGTADFFFDYSAAGIPSAPRSTGGTTRGMLLQANLTAAVFGGLSVSPAGQAFSGDYRLRFDLWQNYNGPLPAGGSGSTQVTGAGVGTAGTTPQWAGGTQDSVWFGTTGDGGSSVDYRAYSSAAATGYVESSGVFAAGTASGIRNNTTAFYSVFGGEAAPEAQLIAFPSQTGATSIGAQGFQWRDVVITKQGSEISWSIDGVRLATVNTANVTLGGSNILFNHFDINATASSDANAPFLLFGLIDNVRVESLAAAVQAPRITGSRISGGNIEIDFAAAANDAPGAFKLQSAPGLTGFADESAAVVTQVSPGNFRASAAAAGPIRFYRIAR